MREIELYRLVPEERAHRLKRPSKSKSRAERLKREAARMLAAAAEPARRKAAQERQKVEREQLRLEREYSAWVAAHETVYLRGADIRRALRSGAQYEALLLSTPLKPEREKL